MRNIRRRITIPLTLHNIKILRCIIIFFYKHKTAYEMRISDWSSDVCSSDLGSEFRPTIESIESALAPDMQLIALAEHPTWRAYGAWCGDGDPADPMVRPMPDDVAVHFYSSGTTGSPKGILWSAANAEYLLRDTSVQDRQSTRLNSSH